MQTAVCEMRSNIPVNSGRIPLSKRSQQGVKRLARRNRKRIRGALINLCRAWRHCDKIKCPYRVYLNRALYILALLGTDLELDLPELPDAINARVRKYLFTKMLIEYYGRAQTE